MSGLPLAEGPDDIFGRADLEVVAVDVPEWGCIVHLRSLPANETLALTEAMQQAPKQTDAMFLLLGACLCKADGSRLITKDEDVERLRGRSGKVLQRLQAVALELQGLGQGASAKNS